MVMHPALRRDGLRKSTMLRLAITALLAAVLCGCGTTGATNSKSDTPGGGPGAGGKGGRRGMGGDVPVTVATAVKRDVPVEVQVIGNVEAYATISVKAQVTGQVTDVYFQEGDFVRKGARLFSIDKRPLQAASMCWPRPETVR